MRSSLNHSNIAAIYGVEEIESRHFLVLELVSGETLADRIKRGAIPIEEVLPIAKQIAEALEAAHGKGIVHRDLKPANVKTTPEGNVKILDFGLAKVREASDTPQAYRTHRLSCRVRCRESSWERQPICLRNRQKGKASTAGRIFGLMDVSSTKC